jgi:hypothetical protein
MKRRLALLSLMTGCAGARGSTPDLPPPTPSLVAPPPNLATRRPPFVVVSIRGLGHEEFAGFAAPREGFMANAVVRPLQPIAVAETAPEMATFETGAEPAAHGIEGAYAMDARFRTETLWEAAERSGLRAARIGSLFVEGSKAMPVRVRSLPQCESLSPGRHVELKVSGPATEFSPVGPVGSHRAARLTELPSSRDRLESLRAYAVGSNRDGADRFTTVYLDDDDDLPSGWTGTARSGQWMHVGVPRRGTARAGTWVKVVALSDDGRATLYIRPTYASRGQPDDFVRDVEAQLGFCPGAPDIDAFRAGRIDATTVGEEIARESEYVVNSARLALATQSDLVVLDIPRLDRIGHAFGLSTDALEVRKAGILTTDRDLASLAQAVGPNGAVLASSGYPFYPSHTKVGIARALRDAGTRVDELKVGTVAAIVRGEPRVATVLTKLVDPKRGDHPFFVEPASAGSFLVRARAGYTLSSNPGDALFGVPRFAGEHGYAGGIGVLFYRGPGTLADGTMQAADVAVTAAGLLKIDAPRGSTGSNRARP